jgi:hypothetical protein
MPNVFTASGSPSSAYSSKMEDTPNPQVEKLLEGLSPEQVQSLLLLLQEGHQPSIQKSEPIKGGFKASPWPKWNEEDLSFPLYLARFRVKIKADQQLLEGPEVTCHEILETLPEIKISQFGDAVWGSNMMSVELRKTRILSEGNSLFVLSMEPSS